MEVQQCTFLFFGLKKNPHKCYNDAMRYDEMSREQMEEYIHQAEQYYNMKAICSYAGISYDTYKGWRYKGLGISDAKLVRVVMAMQKAGGLI